MRAMMSANQGSAAAETSAAEKEALMMLAERGTGSCALRWARARLWVLWVPPPMCVCVDVCVLVSRDETVAVA